MPTMPSQPSMIESWSFDDLRCNVYERERQRSRSIENDRPSFSAWDGRGQWALGREGGIAKPRINLTKLTAGIAAAAAGGLWLLTILKFDVPWFSALPVALMLAGSFIIAASLNPVSADGMTNHDRCDH